MTPPHDRAAHTKKRTLKASRFPRQVNPTLREKSPPATQRDPVLAEREASSALVSDKYRKELAQNLLFVLADSLYEYNPERRRNITLTLPKNAIERITNAILRTAEEMKTCPACKRKESNAEKLLRKYAMENIDLRIAIKDLKKEECPICKKNPCMHGTCL